MKLNKKTIICTILLTIFLMPCSFNMEVFAATSTPENSWVAKTPAPHGVAYEATAVNGRIYLMGWSYNSEYDPTTNNWTEKAPMPTPRSAFGIVAYNNKIYTFGGYRGSKPSNETEIYDTATNKWQTKKPLPSPVINAQANVIDDQIYVMAYKVNYCYNIATDSWSIKGNASHGSSEAAIDGKIYAFSSNYTSIYDPVTDSWSEGASMPIPLVSQSVCATTGIMSPKKIYLFGGLPQLFDSGRNATQVYDPKTDTWTIGEPVPTSRYGAAVAVVEDQIYVIGGATDFYHLTDVNEQYTPFGYGTADETYEPTPSPTFSVSEESPINFEIAIILAGSIIIALSIFLFYKGKKRRAV